MSIANPFGGTKTPSTSTVGAAEINACGVALTHCVDGVAGGTFTPSPAITIAGDGLHCSTLFILDASCVATQAAGSTFSYHGDAIVASGGTFTLNSGAVMTCSAGSSITTATFNGTTTCNGALSLGTGSRTVLLTSTPQFAAGNWVPGNPYWGIVNAALGQPAFIPLGGIPDGSTITKLRIRYKGETSHIPDNMPHVSLIAQDIDGTGTASVDYYDPTVVGATFGAAHWIDSGTIAFAVDTTTHVNFIKFDPEGPSGGVVGGILSAIEVTYTGGTL